ncbi:MAG: O-antigen ligase family protein [Trueperaceae bacterium]|nr:O-antigen ligase family protein [Trueperaceae bacterium]
MLRALTDTHNRFIQLLIVLMAVLFALILGVGVGYAPFYFSLLGGLVVGLAAAWFMVKYPHLTVTVFWVLFTVQATVFSQITIQGLYYPIYGLMLLNVLLLFGQEKRKVPWFTISLYAAFFIIVLLSLFSIAAVVTIDFEIWQKLFIFFLGAVVAFQFRSERSLTHFAYGQIFSMLIISAWVIDTAAKTGFADRGGIGVNENVVSAMIGLGIIPLYTRLIAGKNNFLSRTFILALFMFGLYALLILASRGGTIALAMALFVITMRILFNPKRFIYLIFGGMLALIALSSLPGSNNVFVRFSASDISTLNDRLPLWQAGVSTIMRSTPFQLFFGHGFDASRVVAGTIFGHLDSIHNAYLQFIIEFGIIGLTLFLAIHLVSFFQSWRYDDERALHATGTITALLFFNLTGTTPDTFIYWIALGFALAVSMVKENDRAFFRTTNSDEAKALEPDTSPQTS